ncbi:MULTISPECIES: hypothetical protein [unclassified Streptomyces]|uniref:hypothetical protein n=1 Tax=unclassified Streptomyces TaxID=2593676 RepID=UPI002E7FF1A5|nr:hypothetical protein [Streptomyces sp. NBC_00589]WTI33692.1 hypothetical protein OIC96_01085 [Streptomyces sp. NBC_00775]WUB32636.1 hypothetical protein OHA51_48650 [Streptomyces sp. NBC_00589]
MLKEVKEGEGVHPWGIGPHGTCPPAHELPGPSGQSAASNSHHSWFRLVTHEHGLAFSEVWLLLPDM